MEALRTVTKQDYTEEVGPHWTPEAQAAWEDLKGAILANPCIQRFDHRIIVLRSNFSVKGFGYVLLQPGNDEASANAAKDYLEGKGFTLFYTRYVLVPVAPAEMRFVYTPTLARDFPGITPSTNVVHMSLGNALYGLRIAMPSSSYCPTKAATLQYCACRCALCVGMLTSCIAPIQSWSMRTTGPGVALISNSTHSFRSISNRHARFATLTLHPLTSQCVRRICHITAVHTSNAQTQLRVPMPTHCTSRAF
jgi:hypothetical protein